MDKINPTPDHNFNDDPFAKQGYDPANRSHEPGYSDPRNARFDGDYIDQGHSLDADGFFNPMEDVLKGEYGPNLDRYASEDMPAALSRALLESPEAMQQFRRLSASRRRQIISSVSGDVQAGGQREHVHNVIRKLIIESRKDVELGIE